jgi:hypothetical protein
MPGRSSTKSTVGRTPNPLPDAYKRVAAGRIGEEEFARWVHHRVRG